MALIEKYMKQPIKELEKIKKVLTEFVSESGTNLIGLEFKTQTIFNANSDIIYITDYHGYLLDANDAWIRKVGINPKDFKYFNVMAFYGGTKHSELKGVIKRIRAGDTIYDFDPKCKSVRGKIFDFKINSIHIKKDGKILIVLNVARDKIEYKLTDNKLGDSE